MKLRHSQSQQNQQGVVEALERIRHELLDLLQAAAGEEPLHSAIGRWRQRVSSAISEVGEIAIAASPVPPPGLVKTFVQAGYITTATTPGEPSSGPGQLAIPDDTDIVFDEIPFGTIPYDRSTGFFTLAANKTYRLSGEFLLGYSDTGAFATIEWVDAVTNVALRNGVGRSVNTSEENSNPGTPDNSGLPVAELFYTTTSPQNVKLRLTKLTAGTLDVTYGSTALVQEI